MVARSIELETQRGKRRYSPRRIATFTCEWCKEPFESRGTKPKFCCQSCKERARYRKNRESRLTDSRAYREKNRLQINASRRDRYRSNPEKYRECTRRSYAKFRGDRVRSAIEYQKANPDVVALTRNRRRTAEHFEVTRRDLRRLVERYRSQCAYCGISLAEWGREFPNSMQWDHIVPLSRGGRHSVGNLAPVCRKCNYSKSNSYLAVWIKRERASSDQ